MDFKKPKVIVSECLEFSACRYNGQIIPSRFIRTLKEHVNLVPVCPEVQIGLGIPRDPIKIIEKNNKVSLVQPSTGKNLTAKMKTFAKSYLDALKDVDGFILKAGSPSCGIKDVKYYSKTENAASHKRDSGVFAKEVLDRFGGLAVEDEGRLSNFRIREHFLTKIFLFADFRVLKQKHNMKDLVSFHARNKLLFMAYNQEQMRCLGRVVANHEKNSIVLVFKMYEEHLQKAFIKVARYSSHINVLMHAFGYFKDELGSKEKQYFLNLLDKYRDEKVPLSAILTVLQSWILKYDKEYLQQQTFFNPYPEDLIEITDSGKGREGKK